MFFRLLCLFLSVSFLVPPVFAQDIFNSRGKRQDIPGPRGKRQDIPGPRGRRHDIPAGNRQPRRDFRNLEERKEWIRRNQQTDYGQKLEEQARDQADNQRRHEAFMTDYYFKLQVIKELREQPAGGLADVQLRNLLKEQIWDVYSSMQSLLHILSGPITGISSIYAMDSATLNGRIDDLIWLTEKDPNSASVLGPFKSARQEAMFALKAIKNNDVKQCKLHLRLANALLNKAAVILKALLPVFQAAMNSVILRPGIAKRGNPKKYQTKIETEDTKTKRKKPPPKRVTFEPAAMYLLFWGWLVKIEQEGKDPKPFNCPLKNKASKKSWTLPIRKPAEKPVPVGVGSTHWRAVYFSYYPEFFVHEEHIQVHHAIERQVTWNPLYKGLFTKHEIFLEIENLRGICGDKRAIAIFHQSRIRKAWNKFESYLKENNIKPTRLMVMKFARVIDDRWGKYFYPYQNKKLEPRLP